MELERQFIERTDFSAARGGYDPDEVDRHLREIAQAVEELKRSSQAGEAATSSAATAAAAQVRSIVEAAEQSAGDIQAGARQEADQLTSEAHAAARQTRQAAEDDAQRTRGRAESEASAQVQKVQDVTSQMLERADSIENDLNRLVSELRSRLASLVSDLREGAGSLSTELESLRAGIPVIRTAAPAGAEPDEAKAPAEQAEPEADRARGPAEKAEPEVLEGVQETPAKAAYEATPEEEPAEEQPAVEAEAAPPDFGAALAREEVEEGEIAGETAEEPVAGAGEEPGGAAEGAEGARLIALNMALNGTPREETARYLEENFELGNAAAILDEVYAKVGG